MAAPQPSYPHPGPSNYYQHHPPPPHFAYGNHSPAPPAHGPYQYQYPIPPMNSHSHPIHAPSSPRVTSQGRGYPPSRVGPSYQHHPPPSHHHYPYSQHPHSPGPYPPPPQHPHSHSKYPHPHAQPVPYSPNYVVHPSSPYASSWQSQQQLSPLPKQLSMLPPVSPAPPSSQLPQPEDSLLPSLTDPIPTLETDTTNYEEAQQQPQNSEPPQSPLRSPRIETSSISAPTPAASPTYSNLSSPQIMSGRSPEYVIWSKRPSNPSNAPGIIISPYARPPDDIMQKALHLPSPPPSPEPTEDAVRDQAPTPTPPDHIDVPSPATTETTPATSTAPDTSIPTSPLSTNTSLSVDDSFSGNKSLEPLEPERAATPQAEEISIAPEQPPEIVAAPNEAPVPPAPITPAPKPAAPKPSWASLLRSDGTTPSKPNALPTSSIIGFSIPASALSTIHTAPAISPSKKPELLSLLIYGPSTQPLMKIRPRGLVNTGNMCFANAVLQVLIYCPPFWQLFHELGKFVHGPADGEVLSSKTPLVDATVRFLREFVPKLKPAPEGKGKGVDRAYNGHRDDEDDVMDSLIPTYVYDALKEKKRFDHMRGGHQEDAEEFLGFYLDTLEEELLSISSSLTSNTGNGQAIPKAQKGQLAQEDGPWLEVGKRNRTAVTRTTKTTESPITRMFGGKFRSTLRVPHQKDSVLVEDWRSLRLDIQREQIHTIKDALAYISSPQSVQVTSVTRPGVILDATQLVHIDSLPPILILHLKRFLYDAGAGGVAKVGKQVTFTPELEVGSDVMAPGKKIHSTRYKLFGVLYHHGLSASGGHYTIDVLHPNIDMSATKPREAWIRIDDELVSDVRPDDVFGTPERDDRCAYLLFYRRLDSART
ncbi:cysteine proteinase [Gyrodon lividus]|nr:cysteine proteinase [Gyrodon lividus]